MAINIPDCEVQISPFVISVLSNNTNFTPVEIEQYIRQHFEPCEDQLFDYISDGFVYSLIALYCVIIPIGFFGNLAVIILIAITPKLQKGTNFLLMSLAASDFILTVMQPWTLVNNISYEYEYGNYACRIISPIQGTAVASSIYVLVMMAVERHQAIVYPTHERFFRSKRNVAISVTVLWGLALCFQIPIMIVLKEMVYWNGTEPSGIPGISYYTELHGCVENWSFEQAYSYSIALLVILYIFPLLVLIITYARVGYFLSVRRPVGNVLATRAAARARRKRRLLLLFILLVVLFAVFWGPFFIIQCIRTCREGLCSREAIAFLQWLGHSNVALDPLLYAVLHERIREHFIMNLKLMQKFCLTRCCGRKQSSVSAPLTQLSDSTRPTLADSRPKNVIIKTATPVYTLTVTSHDDTLENKYEKPLSPANTALQDSFVELPGKVTEDSQM